MSWGEGGHPRTLPVITVIRESSLVILSIHIHFNSAFLLLELPFYKGDESPKMFIALFVMTPILHQRSRLNKLWFIYHIL